MRRFGIGATRRSLLELLDGGVSHPSRKLAGDLRSVSIFASLLLMIWLIFIDRLGAFWSRALETGVVDAIGNIILLEKVEKLGRLLLILEIAIKRWCLHFPVL